MRGSHRAMGEPPPHNAEPHRQDAVAVFAAALPAPQHHPGLPEIGARGGLRGEEEIIGEEVMGDGQREVDGSQEVQVPMDADAADVAGGHGVFEDLGGRKAWLSPQPPPHRGA